MSSLRERPDDTFDLANYFLHKYNATSEEIQTVANRTVTPSKLTVKLKETESKMLKTAYMQCKSTREIARYLGISQPSVVRKLKKYGISQSN